MIIIKPCFRRCCCCFCAFIGKLIAFPAAAFKTIPPAAAASSSSTAASDIDPIGGALSDRVRSSVMCCGCIYALYAAILVNSLSIVLLTGGDGVADRDGDQPGDGDEDGQYLNAWLCGRFLCTSIATHNDVVSVESISL